MRVINTLFTTAIILMIFSLSVSSYAGKMAQPGRDPASTELTAIEVDNLLYMREEEKLARDVYRSMYGLWALQVFSNIALSEQQHTDSVKQMLEAYRIPDPVMDDTTGAFVNPILITLYQDMLTRGSSSELQALYTGAAIEEIDMIDLQRAADDSETAAIQALYENLMRGSRNHLRAFVGQIESRGVVYEAQFLSQQQVDSIVDHPVERGGGSGKGRR